jgi:hypothetical protein
MMRYIYQALRCFMLDFWDHSLGECAATPNRVLLKELFQAADTNHTSVMGHHAMTDMPGCVYLLAGGRICWINSVRGEEFSISQPGVRGARAAAVPSAATATQCIVFFDRHTVTELGEALRCMQPLLLF